MCGRRVGAHLLRAATTSSSERFVGGVVTHFLWVSRTTARFRCRLEPGVRAPAPFASPAPPTPRPQPAALRAGRAEPGAHGAARAGRQSQAGAPAPRSAPPSAARPAPSPLFLPPLPGPRAAFPPSPRSRPVQPGLPGSRRPPRRPRSYGQTHRHLQVGESPRAGRGRARRRCDLGRGAPLCGGRPRWGPRCLPFGRQAVTRLNPLLSPLAGVGGGRVGRPRVRAATRAAGRRRRRAWGARRVRPQAAERAPGASDGGRGSGQPSRGPARRPASPVAAAGALRGSGSPAPALGSVWRWEGGREGERKDQPS